MFLRSRGVEWETFSLIRYIVKDKIEEFTRQNARKTQTLFYSSLFLYRSSPDNEKVLSSHFLELHFFRDCDLENNSRDFF